MVIIHNLASGSSYDAFIYNYGSSVFLMADKETSNFPKPRKGMQDISMQKSFLFFRFRKLRFQNGLYKKTVSKICKKSFCLVVGAFIIHTITDKNWIYLFTAGSVIFYNNRKVRSRFPFFSHIKQYFKCFLNFFVGSVLLKLVEISVFTVWKIFFARLYC